MTVLNHNRTAEDVTWAALKPVSLTSPIIDARAVFVQAVWGLVETALAHGVLDIVLCDVRKATLWYVVEIPSRRFVFKKDYLDL